MSNIEGQHSPLFRREATASSGRQWLGTIHLAQPLSSWLISGLAFVILLAFITETERRLRLAQNGERKAVLTQRLQSLNAEANQLAQMEIQRRWNMQKKSTFGFFCLFCSWQNYGLRSKKAIWDRGT